MHLKLLHSIDNLICVVTVVLLWNCIISIIMSPLRRHIFVCFMAKSAFWRGFSALAPYTGVGPIKCLDEICSVHPPLQTLKIWGGGLLPAELGGRVCLVFFVFLSVRHATTLGTESLDGAYKH